MRLRGKGFFFIFNYPLFLNLLCISDNFLFSVKLNVKGPCLDDLGSKEMEQCSRIYKCVHGSFSRVLQVKKCVGSADIYFCLKGQFPCQKPAVSVVCYVQESALDEVEFQLLLHIHCFTCA